MGKSESIHPVTPRQVTFRPFFRKAARREFDEAATWYESQRPGLGREFVLAVAHAVSSACDTPQRFPSTLRDIRCIRIRRFPYSVFFRARSDRLIVIAVFHARRDPAIWRERR
ncbi:MAG: type II toxin-antitoxin system RelE/ParE family toxin [Alphaproteobacteria bacterium]|nr:type II toxin-antitoxin system RelE/ParE family toxin [Alphaproteobacteria bacterium]